MIPKTIHYCWFGRNPLPESAQRCIASWRKFFPDYQIIEWNEDNFDVNAIPYTAQAYAARKYAFVSDFARFQILYDHGGLYFDTDVEVIAPMDDIIARGPFMGFEIDPKAEQAGRDGACGAVAPGLGLGVNPGLGLYAEILQAYREFQFLNPNGSPNQTTVVTYTTQILLRHGLKATPGIQQVAGVFIYPKEYFNPLDDNTGRLVRTPNTRSIHWYTKTWLNRPKWRHKLAQLSHRILGTDTPAKIRRFFLKIFKGSPK